MIREALLVGLGGFAGCISRYLVSGVLLCRILPSPLPLGTFTVNAVGSLLIGCMLGLTGGTDRVVLFVCSGVLWWIYNLFNLLCRAIDDA